MDYEHYIMLTQRAIQLKIRNTEIAKIVTWPSEEERLTLEQEFNRNKHEIVECVVKLRKAEKEMTDWGGSKIE